MRGLERRMLFGQSTVILPSEQLLRLVPLCSSRMHDYLGTLLSGPFVHLHLQVLDKREERDVRWLH